MDHNLMAVVTRLTNERDALASTLETAHAEITGLKRRNANQASIIKSLSDDAKAWRASNDNQASTIKSLKDEVESLNRANKSVEVRNLTQARSIDNLMDEVEALTNELTAAGANKAPLGDDTERRLDLAAAIHDQASATMDMQAALAEAGVVHDMDRIYYQTAHLEASSLVAARVAAGEL